MINILMVDDHLIVREGIKRIINDIPDMNIISEASNGNEAMELILKNTYIWYYSLGYFYAHTKRITNTEVNKKTW